MSRFAKISIVLGALGIGAVILIAYLYANR